MAKFKGRFLVFPRDFFLYATYFPLYLNERDSLKPSLRIQQAKTAVFKMSSVFSPYMRKYVFEQSKEVILVDDEHLLRYLVPKCMMIYNPQNRETLIVVMSFIHEFLLYLQMNRLCYRFHFTAYKCLEAVFNRAEQFKPKNWDIFWDHVKMNSSDQATVDQETLCKKEFQTDMVDRFKKIKEDDDNIGLTFTLTRNECGMIEIDEPMYDEEASDFEEYYGMKYEDLEKDDDGGGRPRKRRKTFLQEEEDGDPEVEEGDPEVEDGDPEVEDGDPEVEDGDPEEEDGDPEEEDGDPFEVDLTPNPDLVEQKARGFKDFERGIAISSLLPGVPPNSKPRTNSSSNNSSGDTCNDECESNIETRTDFSKFEIYTSMMMKEAVARYGAKKLTDKLMQRKCKHCKIRCYRYSYNLFKKQRDLAVVRKCKPVFFM